MNEQQQGHRLDQPPALPDLPDFKALRAPAVERLKHFTQIRDAAQAEIDAANAYLARLEGEKSPRRTRKKGRARTRNYSPSAYRQVLTAVGNHDYAGIRTAASESGMSTAHVALILRAATDNGHVEREQRGRRWRFRITTAGTEFVTCEEG